MSLFSRFRSIRHYVACVAAGTIFGLFIGSYPAGWSASNLGSIASLFGSIILVVGLLLLFGLARRSAKASPAGKGTGATYLATLSLVATFVSVSFILDWAPTAWVRAMPVFHDHLPQGNLLMAGGADGWLYVLLVTVIILTIYTDLLVYMGFRLPRGMKSAKDLPMENEAPRESGSWNLQNEMSGR